MDVTALLKEFCSAVERRDGKAFANLFTEDGVYHDVFYGDFKGRQKIAEMIDDWFHRTARDFRRGAEMPANHHIPTQSISGRYLWERSVSIPWRSITHGSTDRKKVLQTAALPMVRAMRSVLYSA